MKYLCLLHTPDGLPLDQSSAEYADTLAAYAAADATIAEAGELSGNTLRAVLPGFQIFAAEVGHAVTQDLWAAMGLEGRFVQFHNLVVEGVDHLTGAGQQRQEVLREERRHRDLALVEGPLGAAGAGVECLHGHRRLTL